MSLTCVNQVDSSILINWMNPFIILGMTGLLTFYHFYINCCKIYSIKNSVDQGPVVQSIIILTNSLRSQLVKCFMTLKPNTLKFFVEKMREAFALLKLLTCFNKKILAYLRYFKTFEILTSHLTNNVVSSEQPGPDQMLQNATSDLGLHCLLFSFSLDTRHGRINDLRFSTNSTVFQLSGQCEGDHVWLCAMKPHLWLKRLLPLEQFESINTKSAGPSCSKHHWLNELVKGQLVKCFTTL